MATARSQIGGAGTQTSGLGFGGYLAPGNSNSTEEFTRTTTVTRTVSAT
jgi:hypothetical protein